MSTIISFDTIEHSKENIAPKPQGRSALALSKALSPRSSPSELRTVHAATRAQFETDVANSSELDDPLEVWLRYIKWTDETFPQGQNTESGIARLLERCAQQFKGTKQYAGDPRYLRVWLAYSTYSPTPLDIFVFLERNEIGQELALYYEEYAALLERMTRKRKADEVFLRGIRVQARPVERLRKRYAEFQQRLQISPPDPLEPIDPSVPLRTILGATEPAIPTARPSVSRPGKIKVFTDTDDPVPIPGAGGWESIGTLSTLKKENSLPARPWAGETLPQRRGPTSAPGDRLVVFRDEV
jgi:checkpoint serine/threonine-protein kinase